AAIKPHLGPVVIAGRKEHGPEKAHQGEEQANAYGTGNDADQSFHAVSIKRGTPMRQAKSRATPGWFVLPSSAGRGPPPSLCLVPQAPGARLRELGSLALARRRGRAYSGVPPSFL